MSAIHTIWLYDRQVDVDQLLAFHAALQRGVLGRVVASAVLGAAGDRWTADARFAPLEIEPGVVVRAQLEDWLAKQAGGEIHAYGGPAWRLAVTALDDGGSAISLLSLMH